MQIPGDDQNFFELLNDELMSECRPSRQLVITISITNSVVEHEINMFCERNLINQVMIATKI